MQLARNRSDACGLDRHFWTGVGGSPEPAVTLVFALRRELGAALAVGYVVAQITGAVLGTWAAHVMFDENVLQISTKARAGSGLWFAEALATFGLILTIFGTQRWKADMVPVTAGLYIASAYWFTASTSFANPAVTIARCITNTFAGIKPLHAPAFIVAQLLGALAATLFCWFMFAQVSEHANRRQPRRANSATRGYAP
jgi:glycerol uptake facilitator-like aquaporin